MMTFIINNQDKHIYILVDFYKYNFILLKCSTLTRQFAISFNRLSSFKVLEKGNRNMKLIAVATGISYIPMPIFM